SLAGRASGTVALDDVDLGALRILRMARDELFRDRDVDDLAVALALAVHNQAGGRFGRIARLAALVEGAHPLARQRVIRLAPAGQRLADDRAHDAVDAAVGQ